MGSRTNALRFLSVHLGRSTVFFVSFFNFVFLNFFSYAFLLELILRKYSVEGHSRGTSREYVGPVSLELKFGNRLSGVTILAGILFAHRLANLLDTYMMCVTSVALETMTTHHCWPSLHSSEEMPNSSARRLAHMALVLVVHLVPSDSNCALLVRVYKCVGKK